MMNQPNLDEGQWRQILDLLTAATPIDQRPESAKEKLAWYERSAAIVSIKNCLPAKRIYTKREPDKNRIAFEEQKKRSQAQLNLID